MICLAAGALAASIATSAFTLAWMHSIEKIRWEEDWRVERGMLVLEAARIRGTGAGMDLPPDAVLKHGVWHYRPRLAPQAALRLAHSPYTHAYEFCVGGRCQALADRLPGIDNTAMIELRPCSP